MAKDIRPYRPRQKACRHCAAPFMADRPMQHVCGVLCAISIAKAKREQAEARQAKKDRAANRAARAADRAKLKTRADHLRDCQAVINRYVRLRDAALGCASCSKPATWQGQWHASHFRSVGAAPHLRFNLWNIHKACSVCNNHLSGNLAGYRPALVEKIGLKRVEWLESEQERRTYDVEYLQRLKRVMARKCRKMEGRRK